MSITNISKNNLKNIKKNEKELRKESEKIFNQELNIEYTKILTNFLENELNNGVILPVVLQHKTFPRVETVEGLPFIFFPNKELKLLLRSYDVFLEVEVQVYASEVIRTIKLKHTTLVSKLLKDNFKRSVTAYDFLE